MSSLDDLIDLIEIIQNDLNSSKEEKTEEYQSGNKPCFCISQSKPLYYNNSEGWILCENCNPTPNQGPLYRITNWHAFLKNIRLPLPGHCKICRTELIIIKPALLCITCSRYVFEGFWKERFSPKYEFYHIHSCTFLTQPWESKPYFPLLQQFFQRTRK